MSRLPFQRSSWKIFIFTWVLIGILLSIYARIFWDMEPSRAFRFLTAEGNFPQSVAVTALTGYVIYKYFDMKDRLDYAAGAMAGMILWFLILLMLKFVI